MVKLDKIYTRGGDKGQTSLTGGDRVPKHHPRVDAYGDVDEANSAIGIARLYVGNDVDEILALIQNDMFDLGADLSTPYGLENDSKALRILESQVSRLESEIDRFNDGLGALTSFVLPGGSESSAHLHLARAIVRRAERKATLLAEKEQVNPEAIKYLNRLSDLLFVLARYENSLGRDDVLWQPGGGR